MHDFWKSFTIPVYDVNQSHKSFDVDQVDPSDWFDFFRPDESLEQIVQQSNVYIAEKNEKKINKRNIIKPTNVTELKRFMRVCMFMSTWNSQVGVGRLQKTGDADADPDMGIAPLGLSDYRFRYADIGKILSNISSF